MAARVEDSSQNMEPLTPPAQYKVHLGKQRPLQGEGEVFDADQLAPTSPFPAKETSN